VPAGRDNDDGGIDAERQRKKERRIGGGENYDTDGGCEKADPARNQRMTPGTRRASLGPPKHD